jgi:hypothetical protein
VGQREMAMSGRKNRNLDHRSKAVAVENAKRGYRLSRHLRNTDRNGGFESAPVGICPSRVLGNFEVNRHANLRSSILF